MLYEVYYYCITYRMPSIFRSSELRMSHFSGVAPFGLTHFDRSFGTSTELLMESPLPMPDCEDVDDCRWICSWSPTGNVTSGLDLTTGAWLVLLTHAGEELVRSCSLGGCWDRRDLTVESFLLLSIFSTSSIGRSCHIGNLFEVGRTTFSPSLLVSTLYAYCMHR
jgi:hypothetical protein